MIAIMPEETREKWANACASYQEMKEQCLALLEHPESTEEEMMQAAITLRNARMQLESARVRLAELFPRYTISSKGVAVRIHRGNRHFNQTTV